MRRTTQPSCAGGLYRFGRFAAWKEPKGHRRLSVFHEGAEEAEPAKPFSPARTRARLTTNVSRVARVGKASRDSARAEPWAENRERRWR
jgi:hypothetical protein